MVTMVAPIWLLGITTMLLRVVRRRVVRQLTSMISATICVSTRFWWIMTQSPILNGRST